jgi:prepilin-type N-terminal cleavage/methylation domain-containing protein
MRRILRRLHHDQRGLTLVELIVAMGVSTIIIGAVGGFFVASLKAGRTDTSSESNIRQSSNVMSAMTQYIHAATLLPQAGGTYANAITVASPTDVKFYAYVNLTNGTVTQPVQVEFLKDPTTGQILERQWDGTANSLGIYSFSSTISRTLTLGGPVASPTSDSTPLFTYLDGSGNALANPSANYGAIRAIQVNLELGSTTAGAPGNTHIQNTLYLFNVGYSTSTSTASAGS